MTPEARSLQLPDGTRGVIVTGEKARTVKRGDIVTTVSEGGHEYRAEIREVRERRPGEALCQTTGVILSQAPRNVPTNLRDGTRGVTVQGEQARRVKVGDVVTVEDFYGMQFRARLTEVLWRGGSRYASPGYEPQHYEPTGRLSIALCRFEALGTPSHLGIDGGYRSE